MKKVIPYCQVAGFLFTAVLGTFFHFLFDLTHGNIFAALVSGVNESIWEHTKLLFYPMLLFAAIEYFFWGNDIQAFWCIKLLGALSGLILIPVFYYTYTGILGISSHWINIGIFFLVAGITFFLETKLFQKNFSCAVSPSVALLCLVLISTLFTIFTFSPPYIPFFQDPLSGNYGFSTPHNI